MLGQRRRRCADIVQTLGNGNLQIFTNKFNPLPAELPYLNFHPLEVASRYRDPQLQVGENYSYLFNSRPNICKYLRLNTHFIPNDWFSPANKTEKIR